MTIHHLKIWPESFKAVALREKCHEVRQDDRGFETGDVLHLREWLPDVQVYTGRELFARVNYVTEKGTWGLLPDTCVLSIEVLPCTGAAAQLRLSEDQVETVAASLDSKMREEWPIMSPQQRAHIALTLLGPILRNVRAQD